MKTNVAALSLNIVRKMADAAEVEARKLGADVGIAVVAADASIFFTRCMDRVSSQLGRAMMKQAQDALAGANAQNVVFVDNQDGRLCAVAIDGADAQTNDRCVMAALRTIGVGE